jgi:hypothetical protein
MRFPVSLYLREFVSGNMMCKYGLFGIIVVDRCKHEFYMTGVWFFVADIVFGKSEIGNNRPISQSIHNVIVW